MRIQARQFGVAFITLLQFAALGLVPGVVAADDPFDTPERIEYTLRWWVGEDGTTTKQYIIHYQGKQTLQRLKQFTGGSSAPSPFLENILPYIEEGDTLLRKERLEEGKYQWIYRGKHAVTGEQKKSSLLFWLPAMDDPIAVPWSGKDGSRYQYEFKDLDVVNRIEVRMPWEFAGGLEKGERDSNSDVIRKKGVIATLETRELAEGTVTSPPSGVQIPGLNLPGIQVMSTIRSRAGELEPEDREEVFTEHSHWIQRRLKGTLLLGYEGDADETAEGSTVGMGFHLELGYGSSAISTPAPLPDHGGFTISPGYSVTQRYNKSWSWRIASLSVKYLTGDEKPDSTLANGKKRKFEYTDFVLSSSIEYRIPYFGQSKEGGVVHFVDFFAGPQIHYLMFFRESTGTPQGFVPSVGIGARWGITNPRTGILSGRPLSIAVALRYNKFLVETIASSNWSLTLELF